MKKSLAFVTLVLVTVLSAQKKTVPGTHLKGDSPMVTPWAENVDKNNPLPEYPRPTMVREKWKNLNGVWQFGEARPGESLPKRLKENIVVPFPWESYISQINRELDSQHAWYKRSFTVPKSWKGDKVLLHFGAVDFEATVFVNDKYVGSHKGAYDAFSFDITSYLNTTSNELTVLVRDPGTDEAIAYGKQNNDRFENPQRFAYTQSSGIWQTVWLEAVPKTAYIDHLSLVPNIDKEKITAQINPNAGVDKELIAEVSVYDGITLISKGEGLINAPFDIEVSDPKLWSPDHPFLYDIIVKLKDSTKVLDEVKSYMGMRKISIESVGNLKKIFLNNEFLFQIGPLDQGYWPDGIYTAPTDEALKWDVEMIKEWGFNMIRKHIKIEPQRWYYWCDKLGILVWQDMPSTFGTRTESEKNQFELELSRMVDGFGNHPSIIIWVVFNEHWGIYDVERLTKSVMAQDPSRLVIGNSGIDAGRPNIDYEVGHIKDNHSYRPPSVPFATNKRAVVNGEYGAIGYKVPDHIWDLDGPWVHHNYEGKEAATMEYERFIKMIVDDFQKEGLSASVYTQWTDVENEMNGLYTYDRKVIKLDKGRVTQANKATYKK
ncbi:glycoside hydrolase family 2 protein [Ulvibacterium sp.]|uniref:glycoside hydrolase family 2 protein n=1 Tax=Ulvibacterium sp. TaxID=2665914 RepID=UPI002614AACA|nr:sugar-binding domain-containing protein [Ulvibacterium sp.]